MPSAAPQYPEFHGKVAVVTGAARGMGACFAQGLAAQGVHVVAGDIDEQGLKAGAAAFSGAGGGSVTPVGMDVSVPEEHSRVAVGARDQFGRLDYWINNAGVLSGAPVLDITPEQVQATYAVNAAGVLHGCQAAARAFSPGPGAIINMASVTALRPRPGRGAYSMSKAAVDHITRILAVELGGTGLRINAIAPGLIATEMTRQLREDPAAMGQVLKRVPLGRIGEPEDVMDVALFLLSDSARFITGATIVVDGGESQFA